MITEYFWNITSVMKSSFDSHVDLIQIISKALCKYFSRRHLTNLGRHQLAATRSENHYINAFR